MYAVVSCVNHVWQVWETPCSGGKEWEVHYECWLLYGYQDLGYELLLLSSIVYKKGLANLQTLFYEFNMVGPAGLEPATKGL